MGAMFKKQIRITGKHGYIIKKLCNDNKGSNKSVKLNISDSNDINYIFDTYISCYMVAAMVGIINGKSSPIDSGKEYNEEANIFPDVLDKNSLSLERIYEYMVFITENDLDNDAKVRKAFAVSLSDAEAETEQKKLEDYVRGGLEILDDMFSNATTTDLIADQIASMMESTGLIDEFVEEDTSATY